MAVAVFLVALALIPVAVAWACNPQAHISLDRSTYSPGQTITVHGQYFPNNASITVTGPVNGDEVTASGGSFTTSKLTAPSQPGSYTVTASRPTGGYAPASFRVAAPAQQSQGATPSQSSGTPESPATKSEGGSQATPPAAASPPRHTVKAPSVQASKQAPSSSRTSTQTSRSTAGTTRSTAGATQQPVFSGSAAPAAAPTFSAQPAAATTRPAARGRSEAGRARGTAPREAAPSTQTALGDVWSAFQPGRTPSLVAAGGAAPEGGTGSQLAWGIGLLALGLFALVAGLAVTETRRRRAT